MYVSSPTYPKPETLTKDDVFGVFDSTTMTRVSKGMVVARSFDTCPIWGDKVPAKSVTVICDRNQKDEVAYWLEYVHGARSISKRKVLPDGKYAMRSNYKCW